MRSLPLPSALLTALASCFLLAPLPGCSGSGDLPTDQGSASAGSSPGAAGSGQAGSQASSQGGPGGSGQAGQGTSGQPGQGGSGQAGSGQTGGSGQGGVPGQAGSAGATEPGCQAWQATGGPVHVGATALAASGKLALVGNRRSLHRSTDGGSTWGEVPASALGERGVSALAARADEVFVATGRRVLRSADAGATWTDASAGLPQPTVPVDPLLTYLTIESDKLLGIASYRPVQWDPASESWKTLSTSNLDLFDLVAANGDVLYANSVLGTGVHTSVNGGPWVPVKVLGQWGYRAFAFRGSLGLAANETSGVFGTQNKGHTWSPLGQASVEAIGSVRDLLALEGVTLAATSGGLHATHDGAAWTKVSEASLASAASLAASDARLLAAGDRLLASDDGGTSWQPQPLAASTVHQFVSIGEALVALGDDRVFRLGAPAQGWQTSEPSPFAAIAAHDQKLYAVHGVGKIARSVDQGQSWQPLALPAPIAYEYLSAVVSTGNAILIGTADWEGASCGGKAPGHRDGGGVLRSADGGKSWGRSVEGLPVGQPECQVTPRWEPIKALHTVGGVVFAVTGRKGLYRSDDDGASWHEASVGLPVDDTGAPRRLVAFAQGSGTDLVAAVEALAGSLVRSTDGGKSWALLATTGLPATTPIAALASHGPLLFAAVGSPRTAGPDDGVYASSDGGVTWSNLGLGAAALSLGIHGGALHAGAVGRGVFRLPLACDAP